MTKRTVSCEARRWMLTAWYDGWQRASASRFASVGCRMPLRIGGRVYFVTADEAMTAAAKTFDELYASLPVHPDWGVGPDGAPSELAMRGLIARRLRARIQDQLRVHRPDDGHLASLDALVGDPSDDDGDRLGDCVGSSSQIEDFETLSALQAALSREPEQTRKVVLLRLMGEPGPEIADYLDISQAAVRQKLSRFRSARAHELLAA